MKVLERLSCRKDCSKNVWKGKYNIRFLRSPWFFQLSGYNIYLQNVVIIVSRIGIIIKLTQISILIKTFQVFKDKHFFVQMWSLNATYLIISQQIESFIYLCYFFHFQHIIIYSLLLVLLFPVFMTKVLWIRNLYISKSYFIYGQIRFTWFIL